MEALAVMGMENTMRELSTFRADTVKAKNEFYATIAAKNMVSLKDVFVEKDDSIARNTLNVYLIGAHINSNLINVGDYTPQTLKNKQRVKRI